MPFVKCEKCGRYYSITEPKCPQCGNETPSNILSFTSPDTPYDPETLNEVMVGLGIYPRHPIDQHPKDDNKKE